MCFLLMVAKLTVKLFDSVSLYWFSNCLLPNFKKFSDVKKKKNKNKFFTIVLVTASWGLYCSMRPLCGEGLWAVMLAGHLKTDSSSCCHSVYSILLACQKCSTRAFAVCLTHLFCVSFCFVSSVTTEQQKRLSSLAGMTWKVCYHPTAASAEAKLLLC